MKNKIVLILCLVVFAFAFSWGAYIVVVNNHIQVINGHIQLSGTTTTTTSTTTTTTTQPFNVVTADGYDNPAPDCRGTYTNAGIFNTKAFYLRNDGLYRVYYNGSAPQMWILQQVANPGTVVWWSTEASEYSTYTGNFGTTGNPVFNAP